VQKVHPEASLLVPAAQVVVVVRVRLRKRLAALGVLALVEARVGAGSAIRAVRIGGTRRSAPAEVAAVGAGEPPLPVRIDRAVVLVRKENDREQRIRAEERLSLGEDIRIRISGPSAEILVVALEARNWDPSRRRRGIDEESVPRLETGLVATAGLSHTAHEVGEQVRASLRVLRVPLDESASLDVRAKTAFARLARQQAYVRALCARVGSRHLQRRAEHADADVLHGLELSEVSRRTGGDGVARDPFPGLELNAVGLGEAAEEVRDGFGKDLLLVGHRR
jgi:hypothetical protein